MIKFETRVVKAVEQLYFDFDDNPRSGSPTVDVQNSRFVGGLRTLIKIAVDRVVMNGF